MGRALRIVLPVLFGLLPSVALAQAKPDTLPSGATLQVTPTLPATVSDMVLADVQTKPMLLDEFIDNLRKLTDGKLNITMLTTTQSSLVTMPALKMHNVRVGQLLELIAKVRPGIDLTKADGPGEVYFVSCYAIANPNEVLLRQFSTDSVIRWRASVMRGAGRFKGENAQIEAEKEARNQLLTLIQQSLSLGSGQAAPTLQVHEETGVLLFKGTPEQGEIVENTLKLLASPPQSNREEDVNRMQEIARRAQEETVQQGARIKALEVRIEAEQANAMNLLRENERLKIRLEAAQTPGPTTKN